MIKFDNVDQFSLGYLTYYSYSHCMHNGLYYKDIIVNGRENIPPKGEPLLIIPNHQNGVMDALAILHQFHGSRQVVFIARGDVFRNPIVAKILRFLKIMPTYRTRDGGRKDIEKNSDTFATAAKVLNRNNTVCMFPEAMHQHGRYLGDFKKGFPRIAFAAAEQSDFKTKFKILPMAIHYSHYEHLNTQQYISIGEPFAFDDLYELFQNEPNKAYLALNERSRASLKALVLDIEDRENYEALNLLRTVVSNHKAKVEKKRYNIKERFNIEKRCVEQVLALKETEPEKYNTLIEKLNEYKNGLKKYNLRDWLIGSKVNVGSILARFCLMVIALPFYLFTLITNGLPYYLPELIVKKVKDHQLHSSVRYVIGTTVFMIWYLIIMITTWCVSGQFLFTLAFMATGILTFPLLYTYKVNFIKMKSIARYLKVKKTSALQRLITLKKEIIGDF